MSEPFVAEIRIFAGNFAPRNWALCNGQLMPIAQNSALFAILDNIYGGDGETTFGLPNLQGRATMHAGNGPGLTARQIGESGGAAATALSLAQLPEHDHAIAAPTGIADTTTAAGNTWGRSEDGDSFRDSADAPMHPSALANAGGGQPHTNMQPFLALTFIIALTGVFPSP